MIRIILSGEGNSDFGELDHLTKEFTPGPIALLTENILAWHHKVDVSFKFRTRAELKRYPMTLKGKKKKTGIATGRGHSDLAYKLACVAKENRCDVAILMRDARKSEYDTVYQEIKDGFSAAKFDSGIPAVPVPESEAWIVSCIVPERSHRVEDCSRDMKVILEELLKSRNRPHNKETWCEITAGCRVDSVKSPSFVQYTKDIEDVVKYLS
ncbi:MAG: hypothetical protein V2B18_21020 [Pseudomonadota bacterium]